MSCCALPALSLTKLPLIAVREELQNKMSDMSSALKSEKAKNAELESKMLLQNGEDSSKRSTNEQIEELRAELQQQLQRHQTELQTEEERRTKEKADAQKHIGYVYNESNPKRLYTFEENSKKRSTSKMWKWLNCVRNRSAPISTGCRSMRRR